MQPDYKDVEAFGVSRESFEKLKIYHALLLKWQKAINLVSPRTLQNSWQRHFLDSLQVSPYVSRESLVYDLGSGGGFPGMVLALARPDLEFHFIESDERKCQFLRTVSRETQTPVTIHTARIELKTDLLPPDVLTARALADLSLLLDYSMKWVQENPGIECVFMKGAAADEEIEAASERFDFQIQKHASQTDSAAQILHIKNIIQKSSV